MNYIDRERVSIVSACATSTKEAKAKVIEAKKAVKDAEAQVSAIKDRHQKELAAAESELSEITNLIKANKLQEVPTEKLEKKSSAISERIKKLMEEQPKSKELAAAYAALDKVTKDQKAAEDVHELCVVREKLAEKLKQSHEFDVQCGVVEVPCYQTLDEAIEEYIAAIPLLVSISDGLTIDKVGMWQVPNAEIPFVREVFAKPGVSYRYNRLPSDLQWLSFFKGTNYASMPNSRSDSFLVDGVAFIINKQQQESSENEASSHTWMGKMANTAARATTLFAPRGIQQESFHDSGMFYVRSTGQFYSMWPDKVPSAEKVKGKVKETRRSGNYFVEEEVDGLVVQIGTLDSSRLFEHFFTLLHDKLNNALNELADLSKAKSPLALRVKSSVEKVGVIETSIEYRGKRLAEPEIIKEFGAYWDAFVNSPWEGSIKGDMAMIKHLCQRNIERPHVWSLPMKGHYGLRVRTRDHDWIKAEIYCPPASLAPSKPIPPDDVVYCGDMYVRVGPCCIRIIGRSES